jgi:hypothetical protein
MASSQSAPTYISCVSSNRCPGSPQHPDLPASIAHPARVSAAVHNSPTTEPCFQSCDRAIVLHVLSVEIVSIIISRGDAMMTLRKILSFTIRL